MRLLYGRGGGPRGAAMASGAREQVLLEVGGDGVATITLNRPRQRNALSQRLLDELRGVLRECEARQDISCMVLTGAGEAFCAGIDLKEFARGGGVDPRARRGQQPPDTRHAAPRGMLGHRTKLVVGAVNGPAVTGGLELALSCDFLIASTKASFADTHARVGVMPGGGLTVVLPQWVGIPRAKQMSVTGDYVYADKALAWGLVNEVVQPEELLPRARALAATAAKIELRAVRHILATYAATTGGVPEQGWATEQEFKQRYAESDGAEVGKRYEGIRSRGASQQSKL
uniref:Enoyl-CoA hydratase n=1 Tax=Alexandrium catenella TaxID=2925 RepID=A0A7S1WSL0_ALECA|mmetsp:Transcript_85577/g.227361  ORF Transcript_85577/g.227361 Transcript_85577/m.227361 type:complete len:287 (+) Transcript_85577:2-862(+)